MANYITIRNLDNNAIYIGKYRQNITPKKIVDKLEKKFGRLDIYYNSKDVKKMDNFEKKVLDICFQVYLKERDLEYMESLKKSIDLKTENTNTKNIFIKVSTLSGETIELDCKENFTIPEVKYLISNLQGIPILEQRIIFAGKQLDNDDKLCFLDLNIQNDSKLHLVLRLRGGMFSQTTSGQIDYKTKRKIDFDFDTEDDEDD